MSNFWLNKTFTNKLVWAKIECPTKAIWPRKIRFTTDQVVHIMLGADRKKFYPYGESNDGF